MRFFNLEPNQCKNVYLTHKCNLENHDETKLVNIYQNTDSEEEKKAIILILKERGYAKSEIKALLKLP